MGNFFPGLQHLVRVVNQVYVVVCQPCCCSSSWQQPSSPSSSAFTCAGTVRWPRASLLFVSRTPKSVFSFLRQLTTCHCPHMLLRAVLRRRCYWPPPRRPWSNRSVSSGRRAHGSKPAAAAVWERRTDRRTPDTQHTMRAVPEFCVLVTQQVGRWTVQCLSPTVSLSFNDLREVVHKRLSLLFFFFFVFWN